MPLRRPWQRSVVVGLVCALGFGVGCTRLTTLAAGQSEYSAYRKVRTSEQLADRLAASTAYLEAFPNGVWASEVSPWFDQAELAYWARAQTSRDGLEVYLQILPKGPHAAVATQQLAMLREREIDDRREMDELTAATTEQRMSELSRQREDAHHAFTGWLGRVLSIESWGEITSKLPHDTIFAWRIDPPRGACEGDHCVKTIQMDYRLPGGGEEAERLFLMDVVLVLQQGMLTEVRLQGPALFSRLYEVGAKRIVQFNDPHARQEAITYAIDVVRGAAEDRVPEERCALAPSGPIALDRSCDGWTVRVEVAVKIEDDDVVLVRGPAASTQEHVPIDPGSRSGPGADPGADPGTDPQ